jgi:hypothetical protein
MVKLTPCARFIICIQIGILSYTRNSNPMPIFPSFEGERERKREREREREMLIYIENKTLAFDYLQRECDSLI